MARIIKFRGKSIADETWVFGDLIQTSDKKVAIWPIESESHIGIVEVYPDSVGQYTNLLDRKKKEIYEGDIVRQEWETTLCIEDGDAFDASGTQTGPVLSEHKGFVSILILAGIILLWILSSPKTREYPAIAVKSLAINLTIRISSKIYVMNNCKERLKECLSFLILL